MTTEALKSTAITNLDATPPVVPTAGLGGANGLKEISGSVSTTTGKTTGSTYQLVRVRSNCQVKQLILDCGAMSTSAALDFGVYYSDAPNGPFGSLAGTAISQALFASAVDVSSAVRASDITNESGSYTIDKRTEPLWQAAGLSSDPGGDFDIVATATATVTAGALLGLSVKFTS